MGLGQSVFRRIHTAETLNNEDLDDGNSWLCSACTVPIFATPFKSVGNLLLHDGCANLPEELTDQILHPRGRLVRKANITSSSCVKCKRKCGSMMYECPESSCDFILDLLCAVHVTILHRSHDHRLTVIAASASFICGACGTQHPGLSALSYLCKGCDFWIHPDCASLPNAVTLNAHHPHSLFLTYKRPTPSDYTTVQDPYTLQLTYKRLVQRDCTCAICGEVVRSPGVYFCAKCGYYAHIKCAVSDPHSYKQVLIRDAKLAGLCHFPMADERSSLMRCIMEDNTGDHDVNRYESEGGGFFRENMHQHPLMFHDEDVDSDERCCRVCNACVELISSPFYTCSECPDLVLHRRCANLPSQIQHPIHDHVLYLSPKAPVSSPSGCFSCRSCQKWCNRFAYSCKACEYFVDVVCAMMPPSITHQLHSKSHILFMNNDFEFGPMLSTGLSRLGSSYKCGDCRDFTIDTWSAQLPSSSSHKFDEHPLKLIAPDDDHGPRICEICEDDILSFYWYYSCSQCEQSFHCDCIHGFSNFKLGGTIRVDCHDCPLTLIPETTIYGYRCGYCQEIFESRRISEQKPAYECSECFFRIHDECAGKCLLSE